MTTIDGVSKTVYVPGTPDAIPAGTPLAVFPDNVSFLNATFARDPGDLEITSYGKGGTGAVQVHTNYQNTFVVTRGEVAFGQTFALPPGQYLGKITGPIYITASNGKTLTVGAVQFKFEVDEQGVTTFPTLLGGYIPSNGASANIFRVIVMYSSFAMTYPITAKLSIVNSNGQNFRKHNKPMA